ncbi:hypothetical protein [Nonomuraea sp. B5E05]|uniref:hypothetical protein n=1 Tax=Nonomuraea sp. B5E05 TaxID=3153569 RepID=UPI003261127E
MASHDSDDDFGDGAQLVDFQDSFDLVDQAGGEAKLPLVMRVMAAMASVAKSSEFPRPTWSQW